jgi:hypothetical protein
MKNNVIPKLILIILVISFAAARIEAKGTIVGDLTLLGTVQRSGVRLTNDASVFEGDSIRTEKSSGGVLRVGQGRVEIGEATEMEIVSQSPLKIVVKSGVVAFNMPSDMPIEVETPQLQIHANIGDRNLSAVVNATPETEDRFQSRSGYFTVVERQKDGKATHIMPGQIIVATLMPAVTLGTAALEPIAPPQGPIVGQTIARLTEAFGDVRAARAATPNNFARVAANYIFGAGDFVRTLNGRARVDFNDMSFIKLTEGTTVQIQQRGQGNSITRRVTQYVGTIWFSIQKIAGTQTTLETPTAVAAIRGTEGQQDVPTDNQSTHSLNEGVERITEVVTQQSVTIRSGQRVTAIRGVGFTPVVALLAAITQPLVAAGGGAGGGTGGGGGAAGGAGGAATGGAAAGVATATTVTTVAAVSATAVAGTVGVLSTLVPNIANNTQPASQTTPLNPPGQG